MVMELVSADLPDDGQYPSLVRPYLLKRSRRSEAAVGRASAPTPVRLQLTGTRDAVGQMLALFEQVVTLSDVSDPQPYIGRRVLVTATATRRFPLTGGSR
jgi:hypothetical protein